MRISYEGLALPVSKRFSDALINFFQQHDMKGDSVTVNFRDPSYSPENGGFHPVEIRLEKHGEDWHFCYITDFAYVGAGPCAELAKEMDFDFSAGVFQNLFGVFPIEQATDMYQMWEGNFLHYWLELSVFDIKLGD